MKRPDVRQKSWLVTNRMLCLLQHADGSDAPPGSDLGRIEHGSALVPSQNPVQVVKEDQRSGSWVEDLGRCITRFTRSDSMIPCAIECLAGSASRRWDHCPSGGSSALQCVLLRCHRCFAPDGHIHLVVRTRSDPPQSTDRFWSTAAVSEPSEAKRHVEPTRTTPSDWTWLSNPLDVSALQLEECGSKTGGLLTGRVSGAPTLDWPEFSKFQGHVANHLPCPSEVPNLRFQYDWTQQWHPTENSVCFLTVLEKVRVDPQD